MEDKDWKARFARELTELAAIDGISGHEGAVIRRLREMLTPLADRVEVDTLGNLYAYRAGGDAPHLMVEAHSDEIGGLVADILPDGFLRFEIVGGVHEALLIGRKVTVGGHPGVVGVRPGHLLSPAEARTVPELRDLYIDLGLESHQAVLALGVRPGDQITWQSAVEPTANPDRIAGKGIDNRFGCVTLIELLRALKDVALPGPLTAVIAVQEEVGLKGAGVAAERVKPDRALVIDTTPCPDTPDSRGASTFPVRLGAGPVIQVSSGSHARGFLLPERIRAYLCRLADEASIPYQVVPFAFGNTDASSIQLAAGGIPTAAVTVPRRYSHSPVELLDLNDALATFRFAQEVIRHVVDFPPGLAESAGRQ